MTESRTAEAVADAPPSAVALREVVRGWDRAFRLHLLYQGNNPAVERFAEILRRQTAALWETTLALTITVEENALRCGDVPVYVAESGTDNLAFLLFRDGIREITLLPGFEDDDLDAWVALLARVHRLRSEEEDLLTLLWEREWQSFRYRYIDPSAETAQLPLASAAPPPSVEPPVRGEAGPPTSGGTVQPEDFQGALFFLDDGEMRGVATELGAEMERDLVEGVLSALLDRFEDAPPPRQTAIVDVLSELLPTLLGAGHLHHALSLLRELRDAPAAAGEAEERVQTMFGTLARREGLAELLRVAEEVPAVASSAELPELLGLLPPAALPPLLALAEECQVAGVRTAFQTAADALALEHPGAVRALFAAPDPSVATGAARLAGRLGRAELAEPLLRLLQRPEPLLRLAAVEALQRVRAPLAAGALERTLGDGDREVRIAAAKGLAELRHTPARRTLERALASKRLQASDLTERIAVYEAYGSVADADGVRRLERTLNGRDWLGRREDPEARACAALALGRVGSPEARRALATASSDADPVVRSAVGRAMRAGGA